MSYATIAVAVKIVRAAAVAAARERISVASSASWALQRALIGKIFIGIHCKVSRKEVKKIYNKNRRITWISSLFFNIR